MKRSDKKPRRLIGWAGFVDGKLHKAECYGDLGPSKRVVVFTSRSRAKYAYDDVRRVEVREIK